MCSGEGRFAGMTSGLERMVKLETGEGSSTSSDNEGGSFVQIEMKRRTLNEKIRGCPLILLNALHKQVE